MQEEIETLTKQLESAKLREVNHGAQLTTLVATIEHQLEAETNLHSQLKERDDKLVDLQEANAQFNTSILVTQCLCRLCLELCLLKSSVLLCSWVGSLIVSIAL